ncbi:hypothetical protein M9979_02870 [Sphingomonas sp. RP10(2022)]|uniref:Uncharacterized protein n=1 Tax=Sphingomonas liriopis TaxID=2949094 RepID=A0A9X2HW32_9SPHN|nr:hypothetical protein [Sphingomonas liriopis]MCP3733820.1 hypothetical protein [Sphingomonas liriopis]
MRAKFLNLIAAATVLVATGEVESAQAQVLGTVVAPPEQTYCAEPGYRALDFLEGDWLVFENGQPMAFAHAESRQRGCWLSLESKWINDKYRKPGQEFHFAANDIIAYAHGVWTLMSVDIMGQPFIARGRQGPDGIIRFVSIEPRKDRYVRAYFERLPDGSVRSSAEYSDKPEMGAWKPMFEYLYKKLG